MKSLLCIMIFLILQSSAFSQSGGNSSLIEQQTEMLAERDDADIDDDSFLLQLEHFKKHPLNLNEATEEDLRLLIVLSDLQIDNFLGYRRLFGRLISIYELQAVPTWNMHTIEILLPYINVSDAGNAIETLADRWSKGDHNILLRYGRTLEKAKGFRQFSDSENAFNGGPAKVYIRYAYNYKNLLQWGILGDKDAGEEFFRGKQKTGFDFYSFHLYAAKIGKIKSLVIGDFSVNMGQGLVQWQNFAFKKSSMITEIKRQSPVLRPYSSAGEGGFHRGVGMTIQRGRLEGTLYGSLQAVSAHIEDDSISGDHFTSLLTSGYHRTDHEFQEKNNVRQSSWGGCLKLASNSWHVAFNLSSFGFSKRFQKQDLPYNLFSPSGKSFLNSGIDYSYTLKNLHLFGEAAIDKNRNAAFVSGALISLAPALDVSIVYRSISRSYQSFYSNAFTENTIPSNERGTFAGVSFRPSASLQIEGYTDTYQFPWLKYRVDAPSAGNEYLIEVTYSPNKRVEISSRYRNEIKQLNYTAVNWPTHQVDDVAKQSWRIHSSIAITDAFVIKNRCELSWYGSKVGEAEQGFLMFMDLLFKPPNKSWSGNLRLAYFDTDGFDSRIYAYENDVMYSVSVPSFFDKGYRYYINFKFDLSGPCKKFLPKSGAECWIRFAQSIYPDKHEIGSGLDKITGDKKTEVKFQVLMNIR